MNTPVALRKEQSAIPALAMNEAELMKSVRFAANRRQESRHA